MKNIVVTVLLIASLFISCSNKKEFKEVDKMTLSKSRVIGFGIGKAHSPKMAEIKAETNAKMNLLTQVSGLEFSYAKSKGSVTFNTKSKGTLKGVQKVNSYNLGDNRYLSILSSAIKFSDIEIDKASLLETSFRTENLEKSLTEKYKGAIENIIEEKHSNNATVKGKLYLTDITVSDFEEKTDFAVKIKILIII